MASSVTITEQVNDGVKKITFAWIAHTDGVVSGVATTKTYSGKVERFSTTPSGGGTAPTDNYDVVIADADGTDVLHGAGADRDTANTEQVLGSSLGIVAGSVLTFSASGCGSGKAGTARLYLR